MHDMRTFLHDKGFTLIEVLIAMTILSIGILGIAGLAGTAVKAAGVSESMTQANNLAQQKIEELLSVDYRNLHVTDTVATMASLRRNCALTTASSSRPVYTCTPVDPLIQLEGKPFNWSYTATFIDLDGNGEANQNRDGLKRLDITVTWTDSLWRSTKSLTLTTMRTRG